MSGNQVCDFSEIAYVFLDRDGVLNRKPPMGQFVTRWEDLELLSGVEEAIAELNRSGRKVIVITNQRGIALGLYSAKDLEQMHDRLRELLAAHSAHLDGIYVCPHDEGECNCRKPLTGLFEQAFRDFPQARPENSVMVGDSLSDIGAGVKLGMKTVFITGDIDSKSIESRRALELAQTSAASLADVVHRYFRFSQSF
jgi:D-glycero-D-manno-heptose 1,7-bisphosphate phosphatase